MSTKDAKATTATQSLKALLPQVKEQTEVIRRALADLRSERAQLEQQRSSLLDVPMRKEDYLALVHAEIDANADWFAGAVARKLSSKAPADFDIALNHKPGDAREISVLAGSPDMKFDRWCFLFREPMKDAFSRAFSLAKWELKTAAKPVAEVLAEHERLSAAITTLHAQENELLGQVALGVLAALWPIASALRAPLARSAAEH